MTFLLGPGPFSVAFGLISGRPAPPHIFLPTISDLDLLSLHASILPFLHVIILKSKTNKPQLAGDGASQFEKT